MTITQEYLDTVSAIMSETDARFVEYPELTKLFAETCDERSWPLAKDFFTSGEQFSEDNVSAIQEFFSEVDESATG